MNVEMAYAQRTSVISSLDGSALAFAANLRRRPVYFEGRVEEPVMLRQLMGALHEVILSDYRVSPGGRWVLDPVITVHPDELCFEAFSTDESTYCRLSAPMDAFEPQGDPVYGTTNIDFTWQLQDSLQDFRSSRRTMFSVRAGGFGVMTRAGGQTRAHFEHKVDLPESWLKGFLQVQGALAMNAYTFDVRPADLLTMIAYLQDHPKMSRTNGMRFDFRPDEPISAFLEPSDERFVLHGTTYSGYPRTVRVWGRRRLELLQRILPYAQKVTVGLIGRSLPHFYICYCGAYRFTLVLSGWARNDWSKGSAFDLLAPRREIDPEKTAAAYNYLVQHFAASVEMISIHTLLPEPEVLPILFELCRAGRVIYDPVTRKYRLRELFAEPLDIERLFAPDPRIERAQALLKDGRVTLLHFGPSEVRRRETRATATVRAGDKMYEVIVSVDDEGSVRFGVCQCKFFQDNILSRGPCEHILAARYALDQVLSSQEEAPHS